MKTKDLIAKRLRREKATQRKNKNQQISKQSNNVIEERETEYTLPTGFSDEVMKDIQRLPQDAISTEILRRRDMRETLTFTIDPDEAKDFDDALSFQILDSGNYQIGIHIADVTHYVQEQTALDDEAYQRGTSIYLVDRVIPMLPERLSNELCSLRPLEDKLCMSVVVEMDPTAKVIRHKICRTVIRSDYRLTYRQAQDILEDVATLSFSGSSDKKLSEALHEKKVAQIADQIAHRECGVPRFVLISGPSSSGKTTFSKRLTIQLMVNGIRPVVISMDNYFVNREDTPRDENGEWDFEHLNTLDLPLFRQHVSDLLEGKTISLPFYNFETGMREYRGDTLCLEKDTVVILEGLHALNPMLIPNIPREMTFKIYVSSLTTVNLDNHNWIPTVDVRLIRRIVRDYRYRGYSARETIARLDSVQRGEDRWIAPFQEEADVMFNSALLFELAVLKRHAEPILDEVPKYCDEYTTAHRLKKYLSYFESISEREIPPTSFLREFVGGSSFSY